MTDASIASPGVDDIADVGLTVSVAPGFDGGTPVDGEVGATSPECLTSPTVDAADSPALARRWRSSRRGFGAICGRGRGDDGDSTGGAWKLGAFDVGDWFIGDCGHGNATRDDKTGGASHACVFETGTFNKITKLRTPPPSLETQHTSRGEETTHMNSRIIITDGLCVPLSNRSLYNFI